MDKEGQAHGVFEIHSISNPGNQITVDENWQPDLIILNNDLTSGLPEVLENSNQPILPDPKFGWHNRLKSIHFEAYQRVTDEFAKDFALDPWLLSLYFENCEGVSFRHQTGLTCLAKSVEKMLIRIQKKYDDYGIKASLMSL